MCSIVDHCVQHCGPLCAVSWTIVCSIVNQCVQHCIVSLATACVSEVESMCVVCSNVFKL